MDMEESVANIQKYNKLDAFIVTKFITVAFLLQYNLHSLVTLYVSAAFYFLMMTSKCEKQFPR